MSAKEVMEWLPGVLTACAPVLVALVGIIPTVISNRKKTDASIRASNEEMMKQINETKKQVAGVQSTLDAHIREDEDEKARSQRYRILRFYDEMCEHRKHSESHFEDILDDIDDYERYCIEHPDFRNNRGKVAMEHIKSAYGIIKSSGGFLTHDEDDADIIH